MDEIKKTELENSSQSTSASADQAVPFSIEPSPLRDLDERLGNHLVWRIGKAENEEMLVVRVGFASAASEFSHLPKIHNASDEEMTTLKDEGKVRIEWVK